MKVACGRVLKRETEAQRIEINVNTKPMIW